MAKLSDYLKNIFFILLLLQITPPIIKNLVKQYESIIEPQAKVALLTLHGIIYDSAYFTKQLKKYFKSPEIKAILLKIDCAGSAAGTGEAIANEISLLKKEYPKPIIVLAENICASGAYYIAATTDYIIGSPSTLFGSIGTTIPLQFRFDELIKKYDIQYIPISSGNYKNSTDPFSPITQEQKNMLQAVTDSSYQNFIKHVANNRQKLSLASSKTWADGKIFNGIQALELGLIDELGSLTNAINKVKELAMLEEEIEWIRPASYKNVWSILFGNNTGENIQNAQTSYLSIFELLLKKILS